MAFETREKWGKLAHMWITAMETGHDYVIELWSEKEALKVRAALYECARRARTERFMDEKVIEAARDYSINVTGKTVTVYRRVLPEYLRQAVEITDNISSERSLERLQGLLGKATKKDKIKNPYFTRED